MDFVEALRHVSQDDWLEFIQAFLQDGGDIDYQVNQSWGFLHTAVENINTSAIRWLVENGADINLKDAYGWTPLHLAVDADIDQAQQMRKEPQMLATKTLIELGADQTITDPCIRN